MARKSSASFEKRARERARQEKQRDKEARRRQRQANRKERPASSRGDEFVTNEELLPVLASLPEKE
jgi:hypothetical protein